MNELAILATSAYFILPYYFAYLALGIPGLFMSVYLSDDIIDLRDRNLLFTSYVMWPIMLLCSAGEASIRGLKMLGNKFKEVIALMDDMAHAGFAKMLSPIIKRKRQMIKDESLNSTLRFIEETDSSMKSLPRF